MIDKEDELKIESTNKYIYFLYIAKIYCQSIIVVNSNTKIRVNKITTSSKICLDKIILFSIYF